MIRIVPERSRLSKLRPTNSRRLRDQRARDAGQRRRDRVDDEPAAHDRRADRMHALDVLADAGQRAAERRMNDAPHCEPTQKQQHGEAIEVGGPAEQVEAEHAEHRPHLHALQAVGAAGDRTRPCSPARAEHGGDDQRLHQQRQAASCAARRRRRAKPTSAAARGGGDQAGDRLAPAMGGEDARGIGADAEEGRVAQA